MTRDRSIYHLKRRYGQAVVVFKVGQTVTDPKTGDRQTSSQAYSVDRAIVTPTAGSRIAKAQAFNYDIGETTVLLDARDVPAIVDFTTDDFVYQEAGGHKLQVVTWELESETWTLTARIMRGDTVDRTVSVSAENPIGLAETATDEVTP